jgi:hypothetical protein
VQLIEKDAIVPLNDLLDKYGQNILEVEGDAMEFCCTIRTAPSGRCPEASSFPQGYVPTIRQDWLDDLGMQIPHTMPELRAYLEAVKNTDLNGNGQADEIPYLGDSFLYGISNFSRTISAYPSRALTPTANTSMKAAWSNRSTRIPTSRPC